MLVKIAWNFGEKGKAMAQAMKDAAKKVHEKAVKVVKEHSTAAKATAVAAPVVAGATGGLLYNRNKKMEKKQVLKI